MTIKDGNISVVYLGFQNDVFSTKDWQDGLRALLPNINISFGAPPSNPATKSNHQPQKSKSSLHHDCHSISGLCLVSHRCVVAV